MKNFDWSSFTRKIAVKASMSTMYDAWTKASEIEKWFLSKSLYYDAETKQVNPNNNVSKGGSYKWSWYLYDIVEQGEITEANGIDFLQFTFAGECLVEIRLTHKDDWTIVELTQKDIPDDDHSKKNIRLGCDSGWSFYLVNLKSVYEGGLDLRNKDTSLKPMINN